MAPAKSVALVCLAVLAVSSAALGASAAEDAPSTRPAAAAAEKLGVLSKPLGSGLNTPLSLGRKPKYGRRFLSLMQQLVGAARNGDLKLAQQIQQQLFYVTKLRGHRRHLLQSMCPALTSNPVTAPGAAAVKSNTTAPTTTKNATGTTGPLPAIRLATMEPCAEYLCRKDFALVKQADGPVICQRTGQTQDAASTRQVFLPGAIPVEEFAYFQVYDYDALWDTDGDNVVVGAYAGTNVAQANTLDTGRGSLGASSTLEADTQVRIQPNPFLAVRADTLVGGSVNTGVEVSREVGDVATLTFATDVAPFKASGNFGAVVPGTVATERGDEDTEPSDDNVAIRVTNLPALFAFGKRR